MIPSIPDKEPISNPLVQTPIAGKDENVEVMTKFNSNEMIDNKIQENMANDKVSTVTLVPIANEDISNEVPELITSEKISNTNLDPSGIEGISSEEKILSDEENISDKFKDSTAENNVSDNSMSLPTNKNTNNHDVSSNLLISQEKFVDYSAISY